MPLINFYLLAFSNSAKFNYFLDKLNFFDFSLNSQLFNLYSSSFSSSLGIFSFSGDISSLLFGS